MDSRELELIALTQLISRYRVGVTEENEQIDLPELKSQLVAGVPVDDPDIEINIGNLSTESNVTIVEQTVEDDEHHNDEHHNTPTNEQEHQEPEQPPSDQLKESLGGRLFKFFKDNKNDSV